MGMAAQLSLARRLATRDPRLLVDYGRWAIGGRIGSGGPSTAERRLPPGALATGPGRDRLAALVGSWSEGPAYELATGWQRDEAPDGTAAKLVASMAGDVTLGELVYALVRATRPEVVVETGVATGVTSAFALAALEDNGAGRLHSVDLPPAEMLRADAVGCAIPPQLRERWTYHWGSARRLLPRVLAQTAGARRLFVHDSDHSYDNMRWELELAWDALADGEWLVADDVDLNDAFADVCAGRGGDPLVIGQRDKPGATGLVARRTGRK
jgi:predicted O-methyltransferase YrrM